jgi:hypothetical protein
MMGSVEKLARCPSPGCAVRWKTGGDRPCADHLPAPGPGMMLARMVTVRDGDGDGDHEDGGRPQAHRP